MKKKLNLYYELSELLSFDTYKVASVLDVYMNLNDTEYVFQKLQNLILDEFEQAFEDIMKLSVDEIVLMSDMSYFKSQSSYIAYLTSLLELNNIEYIQFRIKEVKSKFVTGSLF